MLPGQDLERFCSAGDHWIIEGCYADVIRASLRWEPELVFLNPGVEVCTANCSTVCGAEAGGDGGGSGSVTECGSCYENAVLVIRCTCKLLGRLDTSRNASSTSSARRSSAGCRSTPCLANIYGKERG
jgi:hypothetical protein